VQKLNNNNGKGIKKMLELSTTHFFFIEIESTNVVETSVEQSKETMEMLVESQSQCTRTTESIGIEWQVLSWHTENNPESVMLITQDDRDQTMLTITKEYQTIIQEIVKGLPNPKGLISNLLDIPGMIHVPWRKSTRMRTVILLRKQFCRGW